jgi:hypothetical protein
MSADNYACTSYKPYTCYIHHLILLYFVELAIFSANYDSYFVQRLRTSGPYFHLPVCLHGMQKNNFAFSDIMNVIIICFLHYIILFLSLAYKYYAAM